LRLLAKWITNVAESNDANLKDLLFRKVTDCLSILDPNYKEVSQLSNINSSLTPTFQHFTSKPSLFLINIIMKFYNILQTFIEEKLNPSLCYQFGIKLANGIEKSKLELMEKKTILKNPDLLVEYHNAFSETLKIFLIV
jgi:hypothetical protein